MSDGRVEGWSSTRRCFLRTGLAGAATACLGRTAAGIGPDPEPAGYIDAHVHVWTPDTRRYPLAEGFRKEQMKPASFTPGELFAHARPCGVSRVVLIQVSYYGFDNSYMLDMMQKYRGVFSGVAVVDEGKRPGEAMRRLAGRGVRGFRIRPGRRSPERWLQGPGMAEMWRTGADEGLAMCLLIDPPFLPSVDRMCRRFPKTPVVIDHFARIGADGVIRRSDLDNLAGLARHQNVWVKVSAFYALGRKRPPYRDLGPMIRRLLEAFGPQRLMWGSDSPFQVVGGHSYHASVELIRSGLDFLSAEDRQWLLRGTAERRFFS